MKNGNDLFRKMPFFKNLVLAFQLGRFATFSSQSLTLPLVEGLVTGRVRYFDPEFLPRTELAYKSLLHLLQQDADEIARGTYPLEVLRPENPISFWSRVPKIFIDGWQVAQRRKSKKAHDFPAEIKGTLNQYPDYFQRQFHYQTGGYLTAESAELYEHQVEILFSGAADAMRRLVLPDLVERFREQTSLRILELAAGTGRLTRFLKLALPQARITVTDLSPAYLKKAQRNLAAFSDLDFLQADAAHLPFKDQQFDLVVSCFFFHELPEPVRRNVIQESSRVLKKDGCMALVDSIQKQDDASLNWGLESFPVDFHEPFYKNYTLVPMEQLLREAGFQEPKKRLGFFSKSLVSARDLLAGSKS